MSLIEVSHLTKRYGAHVAVSDLSFTIEKGGITGFLGPNGAGKSTTMNMIAGCLGPSEGTVRVGGFDVLEEPMKAREKIGYLPELPPLYADMTPREYLNFVAQARRVPRAKLTQETERAMERTRLCDVADRLIANLSKGYRQRVGIAQALLGDPEVVLLDEPTVGLDPQQIIEIRELIRELGREHTVLLSSHILSEVQVVCDRIIILARGKLAASDTAEHLETLLSGGAPVRVLLRADEPAARKALEGLAQVESATFSPEGDGCTRVELTSEPGADVREAIFYRCAETRTPILEMGQSRASLEDVFLELTADDADAHGDPHDGDPHGGAPDDGVPGEGTPEGSETADALPEETEVIL